MVDRPWYTVQAANFSGQVDLTEASGKGEVRGINETCGLITKQIQIGANSGRWIQLKATRKQRIPIKAKVKNGQKKAESKK